MMWSRKVDYNKSKRFTCLCRGRNPTEDVHSRNFKVSLCVSLGTWWYFFTSNRCTHVKAIIYFSFAVNMIVLLIQVNRIENKKRKWSRVLKLFWYRAMINTKSINRTTRFARLSTSDQNNFTSNLKIITIEVWLNYTQGRLFFLLNKCRFDFQMIIYIFLSFYLSR